MSRAPYHAGERIGRSASTLRPASQPLSLVGISLAFALFAGCSSHSPPKVDEERVKQVSGRGYLADAHFGIATSTFSWTVGEFAFDLAMTLPVSTSGMPLVIYLPGLGENRMSGERWRTAWAQAGYAVLSVQVLAEDRDAWSSPAARQGNFDTLARQRYAADVSLRRLQALAALMSEVVRRKSAGDTYFDKIDISRVALAGYDMGAYLAMLASGEVPKAGFVSPVLPLKLAATIALSPYADFSGSPFATRYRNVTIPVLSISGDADADALGAVISPSLRRAPFDNAPAAGAYLLWLSRAGHSVMAGGEDQAVEDTEHPDARGRSQGGNDGEGRQKGGRRQGGKNARSESGDGDKGGGGNFSPTDRAIAGKLIQGVSTAFLDASLKQDEFATEWLRKDAQRWLDQRGTLRYK